jgi:hypothetical protein
VAIENKDFKVKHGLQVANGGIFGDAVTVGTPTENLHAATKEYVDSVAAAPLVPVESDAPEAAVDGQMYFDAESKRLAIYHDGVWTTLATLADAAELPQHIHDTAIGGSGLIVSTFQDAGFYNDSSSSPVDAGFYNTASWNQTWDGGLAIDNFN